MKVDVENNKLYPSRLTPSESNNANAYEGSLKTQTVSMYGFKLDYSGENFSRLNLPTRVYAESVIKAAAKNIKSGENIADNIKIIQIFAPIINANPQKIIYG